MAIETPPRIKPHLKSAPKIRQLYWCDFPEDAHLPELWKRRPVIILSPTSTLYGTVTVIPCSTADQTGNKWAYPLITTIDGRKAWGICDKPSTYAVSRLVPDKSATKRMPEEEFNEVLSLVLQYLPKPR